MQAKNRSPAIEYACAAIYRLQQGRIEFCLVAPYSDSRWEFPRIEVEDGETAQQAALRIVRDWLGVDGELESLEPLDCFDAEWNQLTEHNRVFLVRVSDHPQLVGTIVRKCRWCLLEEARVRIRRKPMRRVLDLALKRLLPPQP